MVDAFWREVRFGLRGLLKDKSFAGLRTDRVDNHR
jgi:hypothetical protein